jgi:hypothetical protein
VEEKKKSKSKAVDLKPPVARKMPVCKLSPALSDVLEVSEATRTDALKKIWEYIKANKLQVRWKRERERKSLFWCRNRGRGSGLVCRNLSCFQFLRSVVSS